MTGKSSFLNPSQEQGDFSFSWLFPFRVSPNPAHHWDETAWGIGYLFARKSPEQKIIGIRTDFRRAGESQGAIVNAHNRGGV